VKQVHEWLILRYPKDGNFLLLEVASVLFVNEDEVEVVTRAELFVHVAECRRQVKPAEEQSDWDRFASHWRAVHDFELCDRLTLVVLIRRRAGGLAADDREFHVLDFDAHEQEIDLPDYHVL